MYQQNHNSIGTPSEQYGRIEDSYAEGPLDDVTHSSVQSELPSRTVDDLRDAYAGDSLDNRSPQRFASNDVTHSSVPSELPSRYLNERRDAYVEEPIHHRPPQHRPRFASNDVTQHRHYAELPVPSRYELPYRYIPYNEMDRSYAGDRYVPFHEENGWQHYQMDSSRHLREPLHNRPLYLNYKASQRYTEVSHSKRGKHGRQYIEESVRNRQTLRHYADLDDSSSLTSSSNGTNY